MSLERMWPYANWVRDKWLCTFVNTDATAVFLSCINMQLRTLCQANDPPKTLADVMGAEWLTSLTTEQVGWLLGWPLTIYLSCGANNGWASQSSAAPTATLVV